MSNNKRIVKQSATEPIAPVAVPSVPAPATPSAQEAAAALLEQMAQEGPHRAYEPMKLVAKINKDRWWITPVGADDPILKLEILSGQILDGLIGRALFVNESKLPVCSSLDGGRHGTLLPDWTNRVPFPNGGFLQNGQECARGRLAVCPLNQFNTGVDRSGNRTAGKRCKESRNLLMLIEQYSEPIVVSLTPTSLAQWDVYADILAKDRSLPAWQRGFAAWVTEISIMQREQSGTDNEYGVAVFHRVRPIEPELVAAVRSLRETNYPLLQAPGIYTTPSFETFAGEKEAKDPSANPAWGFDADPGAEEHDLFE